MNESRRVVIRMTAVSLFILGVMLFLFGTRSTGEALERFKLFVWSDLAAIAGAAFSVLAVVALIGLFLWERRRHLEHF